MTDHAEPTLQVASNRPVLDISPQLRGIVASGVLLLVALVVERMVFGPGYYASLGLHPFWIIVLLATLESGLYVGVATAALAGLSMDWPSRAASADFASYLMDLSTLPLLWLLSAIALGIFRQAELRELQQVKGANLHLLTVNDTLADEILRTDEALQRAEIAVVTQRDDMTFPTDALNVLRDLESAPTAELARSVQAAALHFTFSPVDLLFANAFGELGLVPGTKSECGLSFPLADPTGLFTKASVPGRAIISPADYYKKPGKCIVFAGMPDDVSGLLAVAVVFCADSEAEAKGAVSGRLSFGTGGLCGVVAPAEKDRELELPVRPRPRKPRRAGASMTMEIGPADMFPGAMRMTFAALPYRLLPLACGAIDLAIIARVVSGSLSPMGAIGVHLVAALTLCGLFAVLQKRIESHLLLMLAMLVVCGPMGSFLILIAGLDTAEGKASDNVLNLSSDALAPTSVAEVVFDSIRQGRRPRRLQGSLRNLEQTFLLGDLAQQQRALSAISRFYDPQMLTALRLALTSKRPELRVQAAAVHAKLRGSFGDRAKALLQVQPVDQEWTEQQRQARLAECKAVAASGFIAPAIAEQLLAMRETKVNGLPVPRFAGAAAPRRAPRRQQQYGFETAPPPLKRYTCGGIA